jgi:hypothetical protein
MRVKEAKRDRGVSNYTLTLFPRPLPVTVYPVPGGAGGEARQEARAADARGRGAQPEAAEGARSRAGGRRCGVDERHGRAR